MHKEISNLTTKKKITFSFIAFLTFLIIFTVAINLYESIKIYYDVKKHSIWLGNVHKPDFKYGYAPVPNSFGYELYSAEPNLSYDRKIPLRYDKNGFRIPIKKTESSSITNKRPLVLALGCSFTYGAKVPATNTYTYLVGKQLDGESINAGVSAYGLTQILMKAKELIPKYKPDYILVQYSSWLVDRAQSYFIPTRFGRLPQPYFYEKDGKLKIHPPVFLAKEHKVSLGEYSITNPSFIEYISFVFNTFIPLTIHDDINMLLFNIKKPLGIIPKPTHNEKLIVDFVYKKINDIAVENGSKLVIVGLGGAEQLDMPDILYKLPNVTVVNTHDALMKGIRTVKEYYIKYSHIRGNNPLVIVDIHPNSHAHQIIANTIVEKIKYSTKM